MLVAFTCYSRDQSFSAIGRDEAAQFITAAESIVGTVIGGLLLGIVANAVLLPALAIILVICAVKVWRHEPPSDNITDRSEASEACKVTASLT